MALIISVPTPGQLLVSYWVKPTLKTFSDGRGWGTYPELSDPPDTEVLNTLQAWGMGSMELLLVGTAAHVLRSVGSHGPGGYSLREDLSVSFDHAESDKEQIRISGKWGEKKKKKVTCLEFFCSVPWGVTFEIRFYVSRVQNPAQVLICAIWRPEQM